MEENALGWKLTGGR